MHGSNLIPLKMGYRKIYNITKTMSYNSIVSMYYIVSADFVINIIGASHFVL